MSLLKTILCWPLRSVDWEDVLDELLTTLMAFVFLGTAVVMAVAIVIIPVGGYHVIKAAIYNDWKWVLLLLLIYPDIGLLRSLGKYYESFY